MGLVRDKRIKDLAQYIHQSKIHMLYIEKVLYFAGDQERSWIFSILLKLKKNWKEVNNVTTKENVFVVVYIQELKIRSTIDGYNTDFGFSVGTVLSEVDISLWYIY